MGKLLLTPSAVFSAPVSIPVAGGAPVEVMMKFKHRTKKDLDAFVKGRVDKSDVDAFTEMVSGWDLEDEFSPANIELLLENYIGTAVATFQAYVDELVRGRQKN
ncbi:MAG: phage tail assembly chaperone [Janthinobacterium lividum]